MLGENLQRIRKERGFTKRKLGRIAKVHFNTIEHIEKGINPNPGIYTIDKIAKALEVTVNDLIKK